MKGSAAPVLPPGKEPPVHIGLKVGWVPEPIRARLQEKSGALFERKTEIVISIIPGA